MKQDYLTVISAMGIQGLIPFLDKATRKINIGQYSGCCVAIDAYCWLHKGVCSCVEKLARGEPCDAYVHYCMKFINMLLFHNIKPILVFDGQHLPAKTATEKKRRESRQSSRKRAAELLRAGRTDEARNFLRRSIDVTHEMALALIHECRRRNVDCIVAPYEADAQLAYLNLKNIAQIVITEDSDLVLFGCTKILFKMDLAGNGLLVEQEHLHLAMGTRPEKFNFDKFRYMCILSGCDYLPSLPGIGLSKACKFILRTADTDIHRALSRLPAHLNMKSLTVSEEYRNHFLLADSAFKYQLVFDPLSRRLVRLNEPQDSEKVTDYAGKMLPSDTAYQLALGNLNPFTLQKVDDFNPDMVQQHQNVKTNSWNQLSVAPHASIWSQGYKVPSVCLKQDPRQVDRPSTKGKLLKKEVSFVIQSKRHHDDVSDTCTDVDLTSMYFDMSVHEQPRKRRRSDSCELDEPEVEKENSPVTTPTKQGSSTEKLALQESASEVTPAKHSLPTELTSPVLTTGRSKRNPFFKQMYPDTPQKDLIGSSPSPSATGGREWKFSALSKFGRLKWTQIDDKIIVQSRFFSKQKNYGTKRVTEAAYKGDEQTLKPNVQLQDVSNMLNTDNGTSILDVESFHKTDSASKDCVVKSDTRQFPDGDKTMNAVSLLATLDADGQKLPTDSSTKECLLDCNTSQSSMQKLFVTKSNTDSRNRIKTSAAGTTSLSKAFSWSDNKFGFQKPKSISSLNRSDALIKDFKNPFRKTDSSPKDESMQKTTDRISVNEACVSTLSSLSAEEKEEMVDDSSPADSGLGLGTSVSPDQQPVSFAISDHSLSVDEGFHSPKSSRISRSQSVGLKSKPKACYRPDLSRNGSKQQSLLSMFGFQKKSKLQHM